MDGTAKRDFERRLRNDNDFAFEFKFFSNVTKAAEEYQDECLKAKIELIMKQSDENINKLELKKPADILVELKTIKAIYHNKEKYISVQDIIKEIKIEKSVIESEGEMVPDYLFLILEKFEEILNEKVNKTAKEFDM